MSSLDDEFPLGDGVADLTAYTACPSCGEELELALDPGGGSFQQYIEDCEVCCRPMWLTVSWDDTGAARVDAVNPDEA